ncbi:putative membrane protein [Mycobacterium xenopi 4042]|uniref:Putative membrane protein n=1 Tax=Mycobacterium xenopi 4042 TaxID=1299334 RepID=X7ZCB9_MYCXE|nr:putative membrane protein [Mycobacterium xenopi 4042]
MGLDPVRATPGLNPLNWPPAFCSWFAAGMLLAEWLHSPLGLPHRLARRRVLMAVVALSAYLVGASRWPGRLG